MQCSSLISGSKANVFYLENQDDALLVDAGLSLPKLESTLSQLNINRQKIKGILLTHEHEDHIRHLKRVASAFHLPVYLTEASYKKSGISLRDFRIIKPEDEMIFGSIQVKSFQVLHDAELCLGFVFYAGGKTLFYASDIGSFDDKILAKAENADFIGIEANYEPSMLARCRYPQHLKDRISKGSGHLSNVQAAKFVRYAATKNTKNVMFLHISENSNCVSYVEKIIDQDLTHAVPRPAYIITNRHSFTPMISV
ncbi:MAG: MBL fold metallo-hydrolase [Brevinemataceae bacterium]